MISPHATTGNLSHATSSSTPPYPGNTPFLIPITNMCGRPKQHKLQPKYDPIEHVMATSRRRANYDHTRADYGLAIYMIGSYFKFFCSLPGCKQQTDIM